MHEGRVPTLTPARVAVLRVIATQPGYAAHVARRLGLSRSTAFDHLRNLVRDGLAREDAERVAAPFVVYHATTRGARLLEVLGLAEARGP